MPQIGQWTADQLRFARPAARHGGFYRRQLFDHYLTTYLPFDHNWSKMPQIGQWTADQLRFARPAARHGGFYRRSTDPVLGLRPAQ